MIRTHYYNFFDLRKAYDTVDWLRLMIPETQIGSACHMIPETLELKVAQELYSIDQDPLLQFFDLRKAYDTVDR